MFQNLEPILEPVADFQEQLRNQGLLVYEGVGNI